MGKLGLEVREGLSCAVGGRHEVADVNVIAAKAAGGGNALCLKCARMLTLVVKD